MGRRFAATGVALAAAFVLGGCVSSGAFVCESNDDCGSNGRCEANGFCSFPDAECPSGWEYGSLAGGGFAGMCVEPAGTGTTGTTDPDTSSSSPVTTDDETTVGPSTTLPLTTGPTSSATSTGIMSTGPGESSSSSGTTGAVDEDLVIYFAFEEDPLLIGGALDSSGNDLHADCGQDCPTTLVGVDGNGVFFGPNNTWLEVPNDPRLDFDEAFTIELWIRADGAEGNSFDVMVGRPLGAGGLNSYELVTTPDDDGTGREIRFNVATLQGSDAHCTPSPFELDEWHHVAGVWDGSNTHIYADGQLLSTKLDVVPPEYDDSDLLIGIDNDNDNFQNDWEGAMDELRIYSRALSDAEIAALANR